MGIYKEGSPYAYVLYKARLVSKGYAKREDIDYNEVFSHVVKHSLRILLALVAQYDFELDELDVKTAFLYGDLYEEIYMTQHWGLELQGKKVWFVNFRSHFMD